MATPDRTDVDARRRLRLRVRGAVQGVGFRPFVYGLARRMSLAGFVRNDPQGVLIEVEGARVEDFASALRENAPPLARIDAIEIDFAIATGQRDFEIGATFAGLSSTRIPADAATCDACLDELFDPASRFYRYPFLNCTHCGPRFTLTRKLPYDRAQTSMAKFSMCRACAADYGDPANRRFHAEPIACPECGPRLSHSIDEISRALRSGRIVALKGVGGFHLMCDARKADVVRKLRQNKIRDAKPFAIMVANPASIGQFATPTEEELRLVQTSARPIVLMRSRGVLPDDVAPRLSRIGLVLPYAPVHHLLFAALAPELSRAETSGVALVATSANLGGDPLITDDEEAERQLADIADMIVRHDREIVVRADDSVMQTIDGAPAFIRRARGFTPDPIDLGADGPCVLACGAHLKSTVTITRGREAFVSQHIGDLSNAGTLRFYREAIAHLTGLLDVSPEAVACDMHPDYLSRRFAEETGLPLIPVQHHAAHVAAVAAEHRIDGLVLGAALDGHGFGADGGAWGGELISVRGAEWRREGRLAPLMLPGGDRAAREPWRMALAAGFATDRVDEVLERLSTREYAATLGRIGRGRIAWPSTTSLGRLFDAAAALVLPDVRQHYEGQAAMELEALVDTPRELPGGWRLKDGVVDFSALLTFLIDEAPGAREGAELFHGTLAAGLAAWVAANPHATAGSAIALGGGCMMNRILAEALAANLRTLELQPMFPRLVPANDGGISLGQAFLARAALANS